LSDRLSDRKSPESSERNGFSGPTFFRTSCTYVIRHQNGLGTWRRGLQSRFDKSTAQAKEMKEGALRVL
jgi:hypothetical protein